MKRFYRPLISLGHVAYAVEIRLVTGKVLDLISASSLSFSLLGRLNNSFVNNLYTNRG